MAFKAFDLTGKTALVTGGNGGIGLGMAEGLAQAGADVAIWGVNPEKTARAEARLRSHGGRVLAQRVDVADQAQVEAAMASLLKSFGRLDTLIANAGVSAVEPSFHETPYERWRKVFATNLDGAFFTLQPGLRHMVARAEAGDAGGSVVIISSTSAIDGAAKLDAYGASKTALLGLTRSLAVGYARYGVRVNAVLPGWTRTEMTARNVESPKFNDQVIRRVPQRRWAEPSEFAGIAVYLASEASSFHTGDGIVIDGGYTIF